MRRYMCGCLLLACWSASEALPAPGQQDAAHEIILYIDTGHGAGGDPAAGRQRPAVTRNKTKTTTARSTVKADEDAPGPTEGAGAAADDAPEPPAYNQLSGQSHLGSRESQVVVKPTVIVNFRGTVTHRDSDIRIHGRRRRRRGPAAEDAPNVYSIEQRITLLA